MPQFIDRTGQTYGRLRAVKQADNRNRQIYWLCYCDPKLGGCGNKKEILGGSLGRDTRSCGCLGQENRSRIGKANKGRKRTPEEIARMTATVHTLPKGYSGMRFAMRNYIKNAKSRGLIWEIDEFQFIHLTQGRCYYCGAEPGNRCKHPRQYGVYVYNGIDRKDNNEGYLLDNVVPCCKRCNRAKDTMTEEDFMAFITSIYRYQKSGK